MSKQGLRSNQDKIALEAEQTLDDGEGEEFTEQEILSELVELLAFPEKRPDEFTVDEIYEKYKKVDGNLSKNTVRTRLYRMSQDGVIKARKVFHGKRWCNAYTMNGIEL